MPTEIDELPIQPADPPQLVLRKVKYLQESNASFLGRRAWDPTHSRLHGPDAPIADRAATRIFRTSDD